MPPEEISAEELAEQERLDAIKRGDIIEDIEEIDASADRGDDVPDEEEIVAEEEIEDEDAPEDEDEPEAETVAEDEEPEEEAAAAETLQVPKARFDEVQRKSRDKIQALEQRLKQETQHQVEDSNEDRIAALEAEIETDQDKYEDLLMEGEVKDARVIRKGYAAKQKQLNQMVLAQNSQYTSSAAVEQTRFDIKLAQFEADHPEINPDADEFNEDIAEEVGEVLSAFKARGYTATAALHKAMHYVLPDAADPEPKKDPKIVRGQRAKKSRRRVAKLVKKSPPNLHNKGKDSDKGGRDDGLPNVEKMSMESFDKLTSKQKAELRGDIVDQEVA